MLYDHVISSINYLYQYHKYFLQTHFTFKFDSGQKIHELIFLQQQQTSFEDRFLTSILLEPRSLVFVCDDMYKTYLHGISERTVDKISNSIANIEMCEMAESVQDLTRTTRVSLTIRHVPKCLKAKFLFGKK